MSKSDSEPDLLDSLIRRAQEGEADRLARQMAEAEEIKAREQAGSQGRLEEMWMQEHERQRAIAAERAEKQRQEALLVRYVLVGAAILILAVILVSLLLTRSGGGTEPGSLPLLLAAYA